MININSLDGGGWRVMDCCWCACGNAERRLGILRSGGIMGGWMGREVGWSEGKKRKKSAWKWWQWQGSRVVSCSVWRMWWAVWRAAGCGWCLMAPVLCQHQTHASWNIEPTAPIDVAAGPGPAPPPPLHNAMLSATAQDVWASMDLFGR
jgi:hypothetical protein